MTFFSDTSRLVKCTKNENLVGKIRRIMNVGWLNVQLSLLYFDFVVCNLYYKCGWMIVVCFRAEDLHMRNPEDITLTGYMIG